MPEAVSESRRRRRAVDSASGMRSMSRRLRFGLMGLLAAQLALSGCVSLVPGVRAGAEPVARVEGHVQRARRTSLLLDGEVPHQEALRAEKLVVGGR